MKVPVYRKNGEFEGDLTVDDLDGRLSAPDGPRRLSEVVEKLRGGFWGPKTIWDPDGNPASVMSRVLPSDGLYPIALRRLDRFGLRPVLPDQRLEDVLRVEVRS